MMEDIMEHIKIKLKDSEFVAVDFSVEEVQFLLSRLEIAENALEKVFNNAYLDVKGEDAELMLMMSGNISEEALQQIRS